MDINQFVACVADQFVDTPAEKFAPETNFRDFDEWDSMISLCILSMIKDNFGFFLDPAIMKNCNTIEELFAEVQKRG